MPLSPDSIVQRHADLVYRVALHLLRDPDEAADAAQEALVKVWRGCASIPEARQAAWCARVSRNACLDHLRRRKVRPQPVRDPALAPETISRSPLPDDDAEARDFNHHLDIALGQLGEPYRSIVVLREVEGLAYQEVADALDLPLNTMKVYLHRAKRRLRDLLTEHAPDLIPTS